MIRALALLLAIVLIGLPLGVALTETTTTLAGLAGLLAFAGVLTRSPSLLIAAVAVSLVEALLAFLQAGKPPDLSLALVLGIVVYVLLEVGAVGANFNGVSIDASVWRMKAAYWGWTSMLLGGVGLVVGLFAAALARPFANPLLLQILTVLSAGIVTGAVLGTIRVWQK